MTRDFLDAWFASEPTRCSVGSPGEALLVLLPLLTDNGASLSEEHLAVVALSVRRKVLDAAVLTKGSSSFTVMDPSHIFRWALTRKGRVPVRSIIVGHNHPGGDPTPSPQDSEITSLVIRGGSILNVPVVDHIIVGSEGRFFSFAEERPSMFIFASRQTT